MKQVVMAAAVMAFAAGSAYSDVPLLSIETLMHAEAQDALALAILYPDFSGNELNYSFIVNTNDGSFSYGTLPGQTYNGLSFIMSALGTYDSSTQTFLWTESGFLGGDAWTLEGRAQWSGDPVAAVKGTVSLNGTVIGTASGNLDIDGQGHSSGTLTFTPTGGSPGVYTVTDFVPSDPAVPWTLRWNGHTGQFVALSAKWQQQGNNAGLVLGSSRIVAVPESDTWALMLLGFTGVGLALRSRSVPVRGDTRLHT
jgi:hypothetical protein